jgi:hypothetical protein
MVVQIARDSALKAVRDAAMNEVVQYRHREPRLTLCT